MEFYHPTDLGLKSGNILARDRHLKRTLKLAGDMSSRGHSHSAPDFRPALTRQRTTHFEKAGQSASPDRPT